MIFGENFKGRFHRRLLDCCHSGTMLRMPLDGQTTSLRPKVIPLSVQREANKVQAAEVERVQKQYEGDKNANINASVLLLSGCQDNQTSSDGSTNGLFTEKLKQVWGKKKPTEVKSYSDRLSPI
jgi:hypothetical protein